MAKRLERALNAAISGVFVALGVLVRGATAFAAFVLRRGRHREWRRKGGEASSRSAGSPE
jgi:hypothetical protein